MNTLVNYPHFWKIYFELAEYVRNTTDIEVINYKQSLLLHAEREIDQLILKDSNSNELFTIRSKFASLRNTLNLSLIKSSDINTLSEIKIRAFEWYPDITTISLLRDVWFSKHKVDCNFNSFPLYFSGRTLIAEPVVWLKTATELVGWFHQMAGIIIPKDEYLKKVWEMFVDKHGKKFNYRSFHSLTSVTLNPNDNKLIKVTIKRILEYKLPD